MTTNVGQYNADVPVLIDGEQRTLRFDVAARLITTQEKRATYSANITDLAVVSGATDFLSVIGSSTKTIIVKRILFSATAQSTTQVDLVVLKRSSANSGGSSSLLTIVPHDSTNPAPTAVIRGYTANPTLGNLVGAIRSTEYTVVAEGGNTPTSLIELTFGIEEDQGIILRGASEVMSLNLGGGSISNMMAHISIEWREVVG